MLIYWLLFAFPAVMAITYPVRMPRYGAGAGHVLALGFFVLFYTAIGMFREEIGGDWYNYHDIFEDIRYDSLEYALGRTDPLYGLLNWASAQLGTGIYLVNGLCCLLLGYGVVRAALTLREPWLAVLISVPYLLIVVGMGYVRQGGAIGLMLIALASLDRSRPLRTVGLLIMATALHSSAVVAFPLFVLSLTSRNRGLALVAAIAGAAAFTFFLLPRLGRFEAGYLDAAYESEGALVRISMGLLPALLVLLRWRRFAASVRIRQVWLVIALANIAAMAGLAFVASSTAVDRVGLFLSVIQLAAFGEIRDLLGVSDRTAFLSRLMLIGVAAAVQLVWLVYATNASSWVPYNSVFGAQ